MKIEVGDTVELHNGEVHKVDRMIGDDPDHVNTYGFGPFVIDGVKYHKDGRFSNSGFASLRSVKRIISRASDDTPKLWRDMTDEEKAKVPDNVRNDPANPLRIPWNEWSRSAKGALLLADNEGKAIEWYDFDFDGVWVEDVDFVANLDVYDDLPYRIKPEPVRETVTMGDACARGLGWLFGSAHPSGLTHRITFDLIDGEPDPASIKMEKV